MIGLILAFLIIALITGVLSFGGFIAGASLLLFGKVIFFIFLFLFVAALIKYLFFGEPRR